MMVDCIVCKGGGCSACDTKNSSPLAFIASGKEIEELYEMELDKDYPEDLWVDPAEQDLEGMIQEMIDSEIDFDREYVSDYE